MEETALPTENPRRKLLSELIKFYDKDAEITPEYLEGVEKHYGEDNDKMVTELIKFYDKETEITPEYLQGLYQHYGVKKKEASAPGSPGYGLSDKGAADTLGVTRDGDQIAYEETLPEVTYNNNPEDLNAAQQPEGYVVDPSKNHYGNVVLDVLADGAAIFKNTLFAGSAKALANTVEFVGDMAELGTSPVKIATDDKPTDKFAAWLLKQAEDNKFLNSYVSPEGQASITEDPKNPRAWVGAVAAGSANLAQIMATGGGVGAAAVGGALGLSSIYEAAEAAGVNDNDKVILASVLVPAIGALSMAGLEGITKNKAFTNVLVKEVLGKVGKTNLTSGKVAKVVAEKTPEVFKRFAKGALPEGITEAGEAVVEEGGKMAYDNLLAGDKTTAGKGQFGTTLKDVGTAAWTSGVLGAGLGGAVKAASPSGLSITNVRGKEGFLKGNIATEEGRKQIGGAANAMFASGQLSRTEYERVVKELRAARTKPQAEVPQSENPAAETPQTNTPQIDGVLAYQENILANPQDFEEAEVQQAAAILENPVAALTEYVATVKARMGAMQEGDRVFRWDAPNEELALANELEAELAGIAANEGLVPSESANAPLIEEAVTGQPVEADAERDAIITAIREAQQVAANTTDPQADIAVANLKQQLLDYEASKQSAPVGPEATAQTPAPVENNPVVAGPANAAGNTGTQPNLADTASEVPATKGSGEPVNEVGGITGFHGTPHAFDSFDINKLGTGEGNQAFGHGLYFTNDEAIANHYANKLSTKQKFWDFLIEGGILKLSKSDFDFINTDLDALGFDGESAENANITELNIDGNTEYAPEVFEALQVLFGKNPEKILKENYGLTESEIKRLLEIKKKITNPQLYKVSLHKGKSPADYDYLTWHDKLTSAQLTKIGLGNLEGEITGEKAYKIFIDKLGSQKAASEFLLSKGIDGIVYKSDKGTGGKSGNGRNYVVFNPSEITIEEINGQKNTPSAEKSGEPVNEVKSHAPKAGIENQQEVKPTSDNKPFDTEKWDNHAEHEVLPIGLQWVDKEYNLPMRIVGYGGKKNGATHYHVEYVSSRGKNVIQDEDPIHILNLWDNRVPDSVVYPKGYNQTELAATLAEKSTGTETVAEATTKVTPKKVESQPAPTGSINTKFQTLEKLIGDEAEVILQNGETRKARFVVVSADDILASHHEETFSKTKGYPQTEDGKSINDRNYETDKNAQAEVNRIANNLDNRIITDNPTDAGTPIITRDGIVVSGNNRTMSFKLAAKNNPERIAAYKAELKKKAKRYGINEADIDRIKNPILVRIDEDFSDYNTTELAKYNKSEKKEKSSLEKAVEMSRTIPKQVRDLIGNQAAQFENLSAMYDSSTASNSIFNALVANNIIATNEIPKYYDSSKKSFTPEGKALVENIMIGNILSEDAIRTVNMEGMGKVREVLAKNTIALTENANLKNNFDLKQELAAAIGIINSMRKAGITHLKDYIAQLDIFSPETISPETLAMVIGLRQTPTNFGKFIKSYNEQAEAPASGQSSMFGSPETDNKTSFLDNLVKQLEKNNKLSKDETQAYEQAGKLSKSSNGELTSNRPDGTNSGLTTPSEKAAGSKKATEANKEAVTTEPTSKAEPKKEGTPEKVTFEFTDGETRTGTVVSENPDGTFVIQGDNGRTYPAVKKVKKGSSLVYQTTRTFGTLASTAARTRKATRIEISGINAGATPKKLPVIMKAIAELVAGKFLYNKIRGIGRRGKSPLGVYNTGTAAIMISKANDFSTAAHELGHGLDDEFGIIYGVTNPDIINELNVLSVHGSTPPAGHPDPASYTLGEGFAEFVRAYLINPDQVRAQAPQLTAHFEKALPAPVLTKIKAISNDIRTLFGQDADVITEANVQMDSAGKKKNRIVEFFSTTGALDKSPADKMEEQLFDRMVMLKRGEELAQEMRGGEALKDGKSPYILARLLAGFNDKLQRILNDGLIDHKYNTVKDPVTGEAMTAKWLWEDLDTTTEESLREEMGMVVKLGLSLRAVELLERHQANQIKEALDKGDYVKDSLLHSNPAFAKFTTLNAANKTIPGAKQVNIKLKDDIALTGAGAGLIKDADIAKATVAKFEALKVSDPAKAKRIEEGIRRYQAYADQNLKNMVKGGLLSQDQYDKIKEANAQYFAMQRVMETAPGEPLEVFNKQGSLVATTPNIIQEAHGSSRTTKNPYESLFRTTAKTIKAIDSNAFKLSLRELFIGSRKMYEGDVQALSTVMRQVDQNGENTISIMVNGEKEYWSLEKDLYVAIRSMETISQNNGGAFDIINEAFKLPAKVLRAGVTNWPVFAARNKTRDMLSWLVTSTTNKREAFSGKKAEKAEMSRLFDLYGAGQAGLHLTNEESYYTYMNEAIGELAKDKKNILLNPKTAPKKLWKAYQDMLQHAERSTRMLEFTGTYKQLVAKGYSKHDAATMAAFKARDLMDFAMGGVAIKKANEYSAFLNAAFVGLNKLYRVGKEDPVGTTLRWSVYALAPALLNRLILEGADDDTKRDYQLMPAWRRDMFFNFPVMGGHWLTIPKPFVFGVLASGVERVMDTAFGNDKGMEGYGASAFKSLMPIDEAALVGPIRAAAEVVTNTDFFKGGWVIPYNEAEMEVQYRDVTGASEVGQLLQKMSNDMVDARNIDHMITGFFSYPGKFVLKTGNHLLREKDDDGRIKRGFDWSDTGFVKDDPVYDSRDVQWVISYAKDKAHLNSAEIKSIFTMLKVYGNSSPEGKKEMAEMVLDVAANVRAVYEVADEGELFHTKNLLKLDAKHLKNKNLKF